MKKNICICGAALSETFEAEMIDTIVRKANEYGYSVRIFAALEELAYKTLSSAGEASVFELINYEETCGIVLFGERIKDIDVCRGIIDKAKAHNIPVVAIDMHFDDCYNIAFDYSNAFEKIVRHVIEEHGCRDVFVMGGFRNNSFSDARIDIVRRVMAEQGLTLTDDHIGYGDFWAIPCKAAMEEFFQSGLPLPEAFISVNDTMAMAIIEELRLKGYSVPEDTIVTGFDGVDAEKYYMPRLTTAAQDNQACGTLAVNIIDAIANGGTYAKEHVIQFAVRYSQSCGCQEKKPELYMQYIRALMDRIDSDHQFNRYMNDMREKLTLVKDMNNVYTYLSEFTCRLDVFQNGYVCLNKELLRSDSEFYVKIDNSDPDDDMVLFNYSKDTDFYEDELTTFKKEELLPDYDEHITGVTNVIFTPIHLLDEIYGHCVFPVIDSVLLFYKLAHFSSSLVQVLSIVKQSCEMRKAYRELSAVKAEIEKLYIIDPLTGSYNRRGFYQEFARRVKNKTSGHAVVISADVDYLKVINDTYGHKEGDYAIVALSDALRNGVGDNGIVSRFGGDEYVAVLFADTFSDLQKINVDEIIDSFTEKKNAKDDKPFKLQFSYGYEVVDFPMYRDIDQIIEISDEKMYEMKKEHHAERKG